MALTITSPLVDDRLVMTAFYREKPAKPSTAIVDFSLPDARGGYLCNHHCSYTSLHYGHKNNQQHLLAIIINHNHNPSLAQMATHANRF